MKRISWIGATLSAAACLLVGCSDEKGTPMSGSLVVPAEPALGSLGMWTRDFSTVPTGPLSSNEDDDFSCANVGEVHARFSEPGYTRESVAGLFLSISRIQDTKMTLRVFWDYEGQPAAYEVVPFGDDDLVRDGDFVNLTKIVEHSYRPVRVPTTMRVRVELLLADQTGNCARVREVTLRPPAVDGGALITPDGEAYGHHGQCSGWNTCGDAGTCALWACQAQGYSELVSWETAKPCTQWNTCHLFYAGPNGGVDYNWGNGCAVMGVGGIRCR